MQESIESRHANEITATVENGRIILPDTVRLPDGTRVKITWDQDTGSTVGPYEREPLTAEDIEADLRWATGRRFAK
jgi:hypothetical protein